jgi:hypothetical protein
MKQFISPAEFKDLYRTRHEPEHFIRLAQGYWNIALICTGLLIVGTLSYGAWQFFLGSVSVPTDPPATTGLSFNRAELKGTVEKFEKRIREYERLMSGE